MKEKRRGNEIAGKTELGRWVNDAVYPYGTLLSSR